MPSKYLRRVLIRILTGIKTIIRKTRQPNDNIMKNQREKNILEIVLYNHNLNNHELKRSFVVPGNITVNRGEEVTWRAGKTDLVIFFPNERLLGTNKIVVKSGDTKTVKVNEDIETGVYPYAIYTAEINDFAEGNSMPRMIIK
jgi:plastocyanin